MRSIRSIVLCALTLCATATFGQSANVEPVRAAAGTVLTFYLQTRLNPASVSALDALPKGTQLRARLLDPIDSSVDHDGASFRALLASPVVSANNEVIVHADAEARGLFVLLRSRNHPQGFRYELLLTSVVESGKSLDLTASLNPSFFETQKAEPAGEARSAESKQNGQSPNAPKVADQLRK